MRSILNLILLSALFGALFAGATAKVFSWLTAGAAECEGEAQLDFSGLKIMNDAGRIYVQYLYGDIVLQKKLTSSIRVHYLLQNLTFLGDVVDSQSGQPTMCEWINGFSYENLLPMFNNHNDFPIPHPEATPDCEIEPNTYHIFKVDKFSQLEADSNLSNSYYGLTFTYVEDGKCIGGFNGTFISDDKF